MLIIMFISMSYTSRSLNPGCMPFILPLTIPYTNKTLFLIMCIFVARLYSTGFFRHSVFQQSTHLSLRPSDLSLAFFSKPKFQRLLTVSCLLLSESKSLLHVMPHSRQKHLTIRQSCKFRYHVKQPACPLKTFYCTVRTRVSCVNAATGTQA